MSATERLLSRGRRSRDLSVAEAGVRQAGQLRSARIESLRALAALAVLFSHIYLAAEGGAAYATLWHRSLLGGGFGVWVFFGLTGYLLFLPFARRDLGGGPMLSYRRYALNRAVRILPLYYVVTVASLLLLNHPAGAGTWVRFLLFGENFSRSTVAKVDGPVWSLVVELHFYALLPFLALALAGLARGSRARARIALAVLGTGALLLRWVTVDRVRSVDPLWQYNLPSTFFFFVPGMLLATVKVAWDAGPPAWVRGPLRSPTVWLAATLPLWVLVFDHYDWDPLVGLITFLTVGACVLPLGPSPALHALEWRPLALLGTASYSLYLWHLPIVQHATAHQLRGDSLTEMVVVLLPVCCAIALVSYRVIEAPFLRIRKRWTGVKPSAAETETGIGLARSEYLASARRDATQ